MTYKDRYTTAYYKSMGATSYASAQAVLGKLFEYMKPSSVLELGSGTGSWTKAARELGIQDCLAIDGDWVKPSDLLVPLENFRAHDFEQPLSLNRAFDFAMSLEVAEHLSPQASDRLLECLVSHSNIVLFGAAIPQQGGTQHVNEQWPRYWIDKFHGRNYRCLDLIRPLFWDDPQVVYYYKQNSFLYIREGTHLALVEELKDVIADKYGSSYLYNFIHPYIYEKYAVYAHLTPSSAARKLYRYATGLLFGR